MEVKSWVVGSGVRIGVERVVLMTLLAVISGHAIHIEVRVLVALRPIVDPHEMNVKRGVEESGCVRVWAWIVGVFRNDFQVVGMVVECRLIIRLVRLFNI